MQGLNRSKSIEERDAPIGLHFYSARPDPTVLLLLRHKLGCHFMGSLPVCAIWSAHRHLQQKRQSGGGKFRLQPYTQYHIYFSWYTYTVHTLYQTRQSIRLSNPSTCRSFHWQRSYGRKKKRKELEREGTIWGREEKEREKKERKKKPTPHGRCIATS